MKYFIVRGKEAKAKRGNYLLHHKRMGEGYHYDTNKLRKEVKTYFTKL
jgi:hypothetical protein